MGTPTRRIYHQRKKTQTQLNNARPLWYENIMAAWFNQLITMKG